MCVSGNIHDSCSWPGLYSSVLFSEKGRLSDMCESNDPKLHVMLLKVHEGRLGNRASVTDLSMYLCDAAASRSSNLNENASGLQNCCRMTT